MHLNRRRLLAGGFALCGVAPSGVALARDRRNNFGLDFAPDESQVEALAAQEWAKWKQSTPISVDAAALTRVTTIGQKIVTAGRLRRRDWEYVVFDNPDILAFSLPGGKIGVFTGLLAYVENDDQLAYVIAHEIAHIERRHFAEHMGYVMLTGAMGVDFGSNGEHVMEIEPGQEVRKPAEEGFGVANSRAQETEADQMAIDFMHKARYQPLQAARYWERISDVSVTRTQALFQEHPQNADRMANIISYIQRKRYDRL